METACNQLDELSEDTESIPAVSNSLPELLSKSSYFLKYRPLSHSDWKIWIWGSSSKTESFFHSLAAISKYWFNCRDYEDEFKLSRSLTNFSVALTLDKYPDKETFIAGLSPKPPLEIGKEAWFQARSESWIFKISTNEPLIKLSYLWSSSASRKHGAVHTK